LSEELTLYIPAAHVARFHNVLARLEAVAGVVREKPLPLLDLADLRCFDVSLAGSLERARAPFCYPFLRNEGFNFERPETPVHRIPGVDWMALGGTPEDLARLAAEALRSLGPDPTLRLRPYAALKGPLPQEPRQGDVPLLLRKSGKNFNQPGWVKNAARLMDLPEGRWGEVGISNTSDLLHVFDEHIARLVTRPPRLVLDLGCGLGQIARSLAQRFPQAIVVGLDASAEAIAVARKHFRLKNLKYAAVDFSKPLNFAPGSVDLIVSTNALPYAPDQLAAARELMGLLAPDGVLLNHCRAEESPLFWDFPASLVVPTNTQIFLCDWFAAARESGRATEVRKVLLGLSPAYYQSNQVAAFAGPLKAYVDPRRQEAPGPYAPWASHVLLAHAAQARPADESGLPLQANHFERLEHMLAALPQAPEQILDAAIGAWIGVCGSLMAMPEALDFFAAALPKAEPALRAVLGEALPRLGHVGV